MAPAATCPGHTPKCTACSAAPAVASSSPQPHVHPCIAQHQAAPPRTSITTSPSPSVLLPPRMSSSSPSAPACMSSELPASLKAAAAPCDDSVRAAACTQHAARSGHAVAGHVVTNPCARAACSVHRTPLQHAPAALAAPCHAACGLSVWAVAASHLRWLWAVRSWPEPASVRHAQQAHGSGAARAVCGSMG